MNAIIKFHQKTIVLQVRAVDFNYGISLMYSDETQSRENFDRLRDMGIRCCHTGKNAPCGPSVMLYPTKQDNFQLQVKD